MRSPCHSRILESVLALRLLDATGTAPHAARRVLEFLASSAGAAAGPDRLLAAAALGGRPVGETILPAQIASLAPGFTGTRKRALVHALAVIVDGTDVSAAGGWEEAAFDLSGLHSWARVQVTAVKVVLAHAGGRAEAVGDEDVRLLQDTQQAAHVWEGNVLIHLCVLHALDRLPGTGTVVEAGVRRALALQREDGGWPFVTDTDTWCTVTAGLALAANRAPTNVLERVVGHVSRSQQPGGGWSYTDLAHQTDADDTSVAVQFLHLTDPERHAAAIDRGLHSLRTIACPDGGFPTYLAGAPTEACMTAAAIDALTLCAAAHQSLIDSALRHLADQQADDGSFPPDWSSSRLHTLFRALLAATRSGHSPHTARLIARATHLLRQAQNGDGGFGQQPGDASDPISTAYGLIALCQGDDPAPAARAAAHLAAAVRDDGTVPSRPDSIGPRPFVFTVPALAEIFTLLAFGHLTQRLTSPEPRAAHDPSVSSAHAR
ncbi:hypothetical protein [Kitasatospora sp. NPDC090091]|uniref:prenyltransferase/squalene oxidase repeat-containing protein n=1 Tax=Kitasatospora sp. NPDC090091 TaxID=3364081 RepID=UPI0037FF55CC